MRATENRSATNLRHAIGVTSSEATIADDLVDGPAGKRQHRRAAGHRLDHHQAEWLVPLDREQQRPRARQQRVLHRAIRLADVLDLLAVYPWPDLVLPVIVKDRLNFAGQLEADTGEPGGFDGQVRTFAGRHASEKRDVIVFLVRKHVVGHRNAVVHEVHVRHEFAIRHPLGDRHVVNARVLHVQLAQRRFVRMVDRQDGRLIDEPREGNADNIVEMHDVGPGGGVLNRPRSMIRILQLRPQRIVEGPLRVRVPPFDAARQPGFAVPVHRHVVAAPVKLAGQVRDEQLGPAIASWRDFDERRTNQRNFRIGAYPQMSRVRATTPG